MRLGRRLRHRFGRFSAKLSLNARPLGSDVVQTEQSGPFLCDHDEIDPVGNQILPRTEAGPTDAFDTVALDGIANLSRNDQSEARWPRLDAPGDQEDEVRARHPPRIRLNALEFCAFANASRLCEPVLARGDPYFL
jgi:hypothetical protein